MRAKTACAAAMVSSSTIADQAVGRRPGLLGRLADDDMEADAEAELAAALVGCRLDHADLLGDAAGGSPQVRYLSIVSAATSIACLGGAAEVERRMRLLHRREEQPAALDLDMLAAIG